MFHPPDQRWWDSRRGRPSLPKWLCFECPLRCWSWTHPQTAPGRSQRLEYTGGQLQCMSTFMYVFCTHTHMCIRQRILYESSVVSLVSAYGCLNTTRNFGLHGHLHVSGIEIAYSSEWKLLHWPLEKWYKGGLYPGHYGTCHCICMIYCHKIKCSMWISCEIFCTCTYFCTAPPQTVHFCCDQKQSSEGKHFESVGTQTFSY